MDIMRIISEYSSVILIGVSAFSIILFIIVIILSVRLSKLNKKYNYFMGGKKERPIEDLLLDYIEKVMQVEKDNERIVEECNQIKRNLKSCIQKAGIVRYNAFGDMGGDLCYAIALLDDYDDGIVLNGIHSREGSYTYAKPIENGKSSYVLSAEEAQALQIAQLKNKGKRI
ncbi:MAG: hypothetical protein PWP07_240 [Epulopiscium sp.]|uniref:DUF4446 family protein n=2 Tax=Defluviitalea raffinosedens TaxID=1450156 RepID=A0A7C8LI68_9FIRM|nr:DUF4446 family protein [Defluviitalea raffinosedens]MBM7686043.1 hypothetical protein [Defluviitalea raffinosedens]MBZ4667670.1 hypothetical protein [Defluviitaleaceae bacterium]MDK2787015.1 hypothetical protein [Candidatus Epulonipiscium sp.]HHW67710.1 DUF4446 family protein [Candidatus Epulonipiscium sp.]